MAKQETSGKAFEYVCIYALYMELKDKVDVHIIEDNNYQNVKSSFDSLAGDKKDEYMRAAISGMNIVCALEPNLAYPDKIGKLNLFVQSDKQGQHGDVRDVLCLRDAGNWTIGISCKHDHEAVKHSRLSRTIDFGKEWFGYPVSEKYREAINPIFDELDNLKKEKKRWSEIEQKEERFYKPLLDAFLSEMKNLYTEHYEDLPKSLLQYLLGRKDFYKLIAHSSSKTTEIKAFNIYNTLGMATKSKKSQSKVATLKLPTEILGMNFKKDSNNTLLIYFDNGWSISLRIHNASEYIEPSLKFDVQLVGVPTNMLSRVESWKD